VLADLRKRLSVIQEAYVLTIPPPPVQGIGNAGGFKMMVQDHQGAGSRALEQATGALVAAAVGASDLGLPFQLLAFVVASAAGLGFVLPIARRHLKQPPVLRTGMAALVGRKAQVLEEVTEHGGRVRIGGEVWSARSYDETLVIPAGSAVDVMQIEGATALVYPRE